MKSSSLSPDRSAPRMAPIVLRSASDLHDYLVGPLWRRLPETGTIRVELPEIAPAARHRLQGRLNFWRTVCGCLPSGLAVLGVLAWKAVTLAQTGNWAAGSVVIGIAIALLLGIATKIVAILAARAALYLDVARLWWRLRESGSALQK